MKGKLYQQQPCGASKSEISVLRDTTRTIRREEVLSPSMPCMRSEWDSKVVYVVGRRCRRRRGQRGTWYKNTST